MDIVVQLRSDVASLIHRSGASLHQLAATHPEVRTLSAKLQGIELRPMHSGAGDAALQSYFTALCGTRDSQACRQIAQTLLQEAVVEAAYIKPDADLAIP